jgi:hypothetical protein
LESVRLSPKVIPLSGFRCSCNSRNVKEKFSAVKCLPHFQHFKRLESAIGEMIWKKWFKRKKINVFVLSFSFHFIF